MRTAKIGGTQYNLDAIEQMNKTDFINAHKQVLGKDPERTYAQLMDELKQQKASEKQAEAKAKGKEPAVAEPAATEGAGTGKSK